jgi:flagellar motor switch protein FliN
MESLVKMAALIENDSDALAMQGAAKSKGKPVVKLTSNILSDVEVIVTATLGRGALAVSQLLQLEPGGVVELDTPLDGQLELSLNGNLIARGELVAVDDNYGIRISEIISETP